MNLYYTETPERTAEYMLRLLRGQYAPVAKSLINEAYSQSETGPWFVSSWSRDCDMMESSSITKIENEQQLLEYIIRVIEGIDWADGPSSDSFISEDEYLQLTEEMEGTYTSRDRILEAYENGKGTSIYV
jgi:hypothetical protein